MLKVAPLLVLALFIAAVIYAWDFSGDSESEQLPGPEWGGQGSQGISQTEAEQFQRFALYWLGPAYAGYNLQAILLAGDEITFVYGTCTIPRGRGGGCSLPLEVHVEPVCKITPQLATKFAFPGPPQPLRGDALIVRREVPAIGEAAARIWTGDASVWLHIPVAPERLDEALQALHGLNRTRVGPGKALPTPDFAGCS